MPEVAEGDVLAGKYRVERILGEGGMGLVVSATHLALDERVALKFMRASAMGREDGVQRFLREARAAVKLKSEHVARVLDVGTLETGAPYIVMEHLEGRDLARVLADRRTLPREEAIDYLLQACDAIAEAHSLGIIHRDLKPANLFVTSGRDGAPLVKVLDFGISKINVLGDRPESVTSSEMLLGSPVYMSPEQMKSSRDVGPTSDIWSLGVILYETFAGRVPFNGQTMGSLMAKVLTEPPPMGALEHLPPELVRVVGRCLEKEPAQRYASVLELARGLSPFGPPSSEARVARMLSMGRQSFNSFAPTPTLSPLAATQNERTLGAATTQAVTGPADGETTSPASRRRHVGLYATLALVGVGVAVASFVGTRAPAPPSPAPAAASAPAAEVNATPAASAEPVATAPSASAAPSAADSAAATASTKATTGTPRGALPPAAPRPRASAVPKDPFGSNRE